MKPKVYKAKENYKREDIVKRLTADNKFEQVGDLKNNHDENVKLYLFRELSPKTTSDWIKELEIFFKVEPKYEQIASQYNAIMLVETSKSIYLLPNGYAYHTVEKVADPDFGLSFAEKTVSEDGISLKGVTYIQRNKIREVTHFKEEQNEFPQASESYFSISATPIDEEIFGNNIDCGKAISFSKNYQLNDEKGKDDFLKLFNEIDIAYYDNEGVSTFPRFKLLEKKDNKNEKLDQSLLNILKEEESSTDISLGINRIQLAGNKIEILDAINKIYVHRKYNPHKKQEIGINGENLDTFIQERHEKIDSMDDLRLIVSNNNDEIKSGPLKNFIFAQVESNTSKGNEVFILDEGKWGYFNDRFYELLDQKMDEINEKVNFDDKYNIKYSVVKDKFEGEDAYIEKLLDKNNNLYELHKRFISSEGIDIELADIYDSDEDELLTIKRGVKTSTAIYSFEQSILGTRMLSNQEEFEVKENLEKIRKQHNKLPDRVIDEILVCRNQRVLWLVSDTPEYVHEGVKDKSFKVGELKSILLRLKIVDWYTYLQENNYDIKLYFALDRQVQKNNKEIVWLWCRNSIILST